MKNKYLLIPFVIIVSSCIQTEKPSFCFINDSSKAYIEQNGDLYGADILSFESYSEFNKNSTADDIKRTIDIGNQALVYLYSTTCPTCKKYFPYIKELENDSKLGINFIEYSNYSTNYIEILKSYFPNGNYSSVLSGISIPSLYLFKSPLTVEKIDISSVQSGTAIENIIQPLVNVTNIINCRTFTGLISYLRTSGSLVYILNSANRESNSFLDSSINAKAKYSDKPTIIVDWQRLSEQDKTNIKSLFSINLDFEVVLKVNKNGAVIDVAPYISETENANQIISDYYSN